MSSLTELLANAAEMAILYPVVFIVGVVVITVAPLPTGYDRGKIRWQTWCSTGMHWHTVYWTGNGFQTLHPADRSDSS